MAPWAWGANGAGQLGDGTATMRTAPVAVSRALQWVAITAGTAHALALKGDGTVWAWGSNAHGQLGDGTTTTRTTPAGDCAPARHTAISAHANISHAVETDRTLWSWGDNYGGALGDGTTTARSTPVATTGLTTVASAGGGDHSSYATLVSGAGKSWGYGADGELGNGTWSSGQAGPGAVTGVTTAVTIAGAVRTPSPCWPMGRSGRGATTRWGSLATARSRCATRPCSRPVRVTWSPSLAVTIFRSRSRRTDGSGRGAKTRARNSAMGLTLARLTPTQIADAAFAWHVATWTCFARRILECERQRHGQ